MTTSRDYRKGLLKTYTAVIQRASSSNGIAAVATAFPIAYVMDVSIIYYFQNPLSTIIGTAHAALFLLWILSTSSIWCAAQNALSVAMYLNHAIGIWIDVSFLSHIIYGVSLLPIQYSSIPVVFLMPLPIVLHITADIQRAVRTRLYVGR